MKNLTDLKVGESAIIQELLSSDLARIMMTMGIVPEKEIKLVRKSPLGDSLYVELETHNIALRKEEASTIIIR